MNDRGVGILTQYAFNVEKVTRVRGGLLCNTDQGLKLVKEFRGSEYRLQTLEKVMSALRMGGMEQVDQIVRNEQELLWTADYDGVHYIVKDWYDGKECDVKNIKDIALGAQLIAGCHKILAYFPREEEKEASCNLGESGKNIAKDYEKRNKELKRVRNFIRQKNHKNEFELCLLQNFPEFFEKAQQAYEMAQNCVYQQLLEQAEKNGSIAHGSYQHHNILLEKKVAAVTNWEHCRNDVQIYDLYQFMRKIMEKHNWEKEVGDRILQSYDKIKTIDKQEMEVLKVLLSYPEKFWKIANHYNNNNKAWMPVKNVEKLNMVRKQYREKEKFLQDIF